MLLHLTLSYSFSFSTNRIRRRQTPGWQSRL